MGIDGKTSSVKLAFAQQIGHRLAFQTALRQSLQGLQGRFRQIVRTACNQLRARAFLQPSAYCNNIRASFLGSADWRNHSSSVIFRPICQRCGFSFLTLSGKRADGGNRKCSIPKIKSDTVAHDIRCIPSFIDVYGFHTESHQRQAPKCRMDRHDLLPQRQQHNGRQPNIIGIGRTISDVQRNKYRPQNQNGQTFMLS